MNLPKQSLSVAFQLLTILFFFSNDINAQDKCANFFSFYEGSIFEYTFYDKSEEMDSRTVHELFLIEEGEEDDSFIGVVKTQVYDKDEALLFDEQYELSCTGGAYSVDLSALINPSIKTDGIGADISVEGTALEFPSELSVGDELPDASTTITVSSNGVNLLKTTIDVFDRKVVKQEQITTPAGTFDCYKITYTCEQKAVLRQTTKITEWWAEGVGLVKSETYKKNGKLVASQVLTKLEKGE